MMRGENDGEDSSDESDSTRTRWKELRNED